MSEKAPADQAALDAALDRYAAFFDALSPDTLPELDALVTDHVRFVDPFNDVTGPAKMRRIFEHMFEALEEPGFDVLDRARGQRAAYLRWDFTFGFRGRDWLIKGMSEVHQQADGRIAAHIDHWDAGGQFYAHLPILRTAIGWIARRMKV